MQDLIRIRVADPAEDMRIGQSALQSMVPDREAASELSKRRRHDIHASRIQCGQSRFALGHMQGRTLLRTSLSKGEAAVVEQECCEGAAAVGLLRSLAPM